MEKPYLAKDASDVLANENADICKLVICKACRSALLVLLHPECAIPTSPRVSNDMILHQRIIIYLISQLKSPYYKSTVAHMSDT